VLPVAPSLAPPSALSSPASASGAPLLALSGVSAVSSVDSYDSSSSSVGNLYCLFNFISPILLKLVVFISNACFTDSINSPLSRTLKY